MEDPRSRVRILYPENAARLPERLPLTAKLLASPRAMARLRAAVHGRPAFLVPGAQHMPLAVSNANAS